jgi:hypothetical protein
MKLYCLDCSFVSIYCIYQIKAKVGSYEQKQFESQYNNLHVEIIVPNRTNTNIN